MMYVIQFAFPLGEKGGVQIKSNMILNRLHTWQDHLSLCPWSHFTQQEDKRSSCSVALGPNWFPTVWKKLRGKEEAPDDEGGWQCWQSEAQQWLEALS